MSNKDSHGALVWMQSHLFLVLRLQLLEGDGAEDAVGHHQADHHEVREHHRAQLPRVVQHLKRTQNLNEVNIM